MAQYRYVRQWRYVDQDGCVGFAETKAQAKRRNEWNDVQEVFAIFAGKTVIADAYDTQNAQDIVNALKRAGA